MKNLSVREFCQQAGISKALFYKMARNGNGPRIMKVGRRTLISIEAAEDWQHKLEAVRLAA